MENRKWKTHFPFGYSSWEFRTTIQDVPLILENFPSGKSNEFFRKWSQPMSVEVSQVTMPPKRTIESLFTAASKQSCQNMENETAAEKEKLGPDRNEMSNLP